MIRRVGPGNERNCVTGTANGTLRAMVSSRPHRRLQWLRLLALGLFALGMALQPVLAAAGELHALAHDPGGDHAQALHDAEGEQDRLEADGPDGEAATMHTLLHFSHCCGTTAAAVPVTKPAAIAIVRDPPLIDEASVPRQARLPAPFKPPIG